MKMNLKSLIAGAVLTALAISARADTAGLYDLIVGFRATGAANDVQIDFGNVNNYTAPGTYTLGNFASVLSGGTTYGSTWNSVTGTNAVNWSAGAVWKDVNNVLPTQVWGTKKWGTAAGTLGVANSTAFAAASNSTLNTANTKLGNTYNVMGTYTVGVAKLAAPATIGSWSNSNTGSGLGVSAFTLASFQHATSDLANGGSIGNAASFSASDLYLAANSTTPSVAQFVGTFALYQNGDLTFTVIPEPSTYAALLGLATLGFAAIRRRKQQLEVQA
jgi:hypothetical protein